MPSVARLTLVTILLPAPAAALDLPADAPFVTATLDGRPVRLRVDFAAPGLVMLAPAAARRLRLVATAGSTVMIGPIRLAGRSGSGILGLDHRQQPVLLLWNDRLPTDDPTIDGLVSPGALPVAALRLIRAVPAGTRTTLPARFDVAAGLISGFQLGGRRVELRLSPANVSTSASAAAGAVIAARRDGRFDAVVGERTILFGVARPVRTLHLGTPLVVAGRRIDRLLVRTADYPGTTAPPPVVVADEDEIVVTGRPAGRARYRLDLGADVLGSCAMIDWDARRRTLRLDCPATSSHDGAAGFR